MLNYSRQVFRRFHSKKEDEGKEIKEEENQDRVSE
jgi:hypothetical protein